MTVNIVYDTSGFRNNFAIVRETFSLFVRTMQRGSAWDNPWFEHCVRDDAIVCSELTSTRHIYSATQLATKRRNPYSSRLARTQPVNSSSAQWKNTVQSTSHLAQTSYGIKKLGKLLTFKGYDTLKRRHYLWPDHPMRATYAAVQFL
jgi:hypothetical protein